MDQELNGLSRVSRDNGVSSDNGENDNDLFLELLSISFHYEDNRKSELDASQPSRKCFLSAIVPFCGGGTLCERLWKGLSSCAGNYMQSVDALLVTNMIQKYHLAREIARALRYCHELGIVHSDLCCCNILLTPNKRSTPGASFSVKVANTGVLPDADSFIKRRAYLAPELLAALPAPFEGGTPSPHSYSSPSTSSSFPSSPPSPSLLSICSLDGPTVLFTKESDVYALGITLLQVFRHTLDDCAPDICKFAAEKTAGGLRVPCFPKDRSSSFSTLPETLRDIISSCTRRDSKARPSSAEIRSVGNFGFCNICI